ncbi:MAG: mannose-1-phosphate guanylyltransferase [Mariniphaga sp.]|nr:mannose-1-phosphate guanylyltransferase [Mariniphaga sp.]
MKDLFCLIMAGGSGTRFWPWSRTVKPKQFFKIFNDESLIQSTISRFSTFISTENIYIVSNKSQSAVLEGQTSMLYRENLIYEPVGKNTLPCIGLAAMFAELENPEGIMVVSPSDHHIHNEKLFSETIHAAIIIALENEGIVTIGITPNSPATGYGYIQTAEDITGRNSIKQFKIKQFVENPTKSQQPVTLKREDFIGTAVYLFLKYRYFLNQ